MSTKKLLILTAVFLALLGFVVFYERFQPTSEDAAKARKKLINFKAETLSGMTIERPDLPKVELKKTGDRWLLAGETADAAVVTGLVTDLGRLDVVGDTRSSFDPVELGLDVPRAKVILSFSDGRKADIRFGKEIPGTDTTAAAADGRFGAVRFAPVASLVKPLDDFRSKTLFDVPASEITGVTVSRGASRVVVSRTPGSGEKRSGEWRIEEPVKDLASRSFVEQLLADLSGARVSDFPPAGTTDLAKFGLQPPVSTVDLVKGTEVVAALAFGAAKAEAAGKMYARRGKSVVVIDDRVQDDLAKEFTAFRERKICPVDVWATERVALDAGGDRCGAERVEGEWRSAGKTVPSTAVEDLLDRIGRIDATAFVARKDYPALGLPAAGKKLPPPSMSVEVTSKGEGPRSLRFYDAPAASTPSLVVEVSGRGEAMRVERTAVDELKALAAKIKPAESRTAPAKK